MVQWLRAVAALMEDERSVASVYLIRTLKRGKGK